MFKIVNVIIDDALRHNSFMKIENIGELIINNVLYAKKLSRIEYKRLIMSQKIIK